MLRAWGFWPALVMVACQWQATHLIQKPPMMHILLVTFLGTIGTYWADRFLERHQGFKTEARHKKTPLADKIMLPPLIILGLLQLPNFNSAQWLWLMLLGITGLIYLGFTTRILPMFAPLKELTGAFCFTYLTWGLLPIEPVLLVSFFFMAFANFCYAGHSDRLRDKSNQLKSLSLYSCKANLNIAKISSLIACLGFFYAAGIDQAFFWISFLHLGYQNSWKQSIDISFLPLVPWALIQLLPW